MDSVRDISDSTDWLPTAIPLLAPFESSIRCQVCKDVYNTPMITSCAHTFCSLCIQRCLSNDGRCPTCREQDQPSKLRKNWAVQEIVNLFAEARPQALLIAQDHKALQARLADKSKAANAGTARPKRKWSNMEEDEETLRSQKSARQTRSQAKRMSATGGSQDPVEVGDETDESYVPEQASPVQLRVPDDGLVECPMCSSRMKEEVMWSHVDKCTGTPAPVQSRTTTSQAQIPSHGSRQVKSNIPRLATPNFALLKDGALKRKIVDLGVPAWGDRQLLIRRLTEWINLYNSNADSSHPRSNRELLNELEMWERSQGGQAHHRIPKTREKDFDAKGWQDSNKSQFDDLIAAARAKRTKAEPSTNGASEQSTAAVDGETTTGNPPGADAVPKPFTEDSKVLAPSSATLTASTDPLMREAESAQVPDAEPHSSDPLSRGQNGSRHASSPTPHINHIPTEKKPMFTLPAEAFYDGDGIGESTQG